jgi:nucleotide-binding universal stress UspA family protein/predicted transcriptional regulator
VIGDTSLLLVRVVRSSRYETAYLAEGVHKHHTLPEWREAEQYLGELRHRFQNEGVEVQTRIREGLIAQNLLDLADDENAAAIALATHGRHGMARFVLGSVAEGLVREARVPIFVVPAGAARRGRPPAFGRILVPLDRSTLAEQAIEYVSEIASPDATVVLIHVLLPDDAEADTPNTLLVGPDGQHRAEGRARDYLNDVAHRLHERGRKAQIMTARGRAAPEIIRATHEAQADAVVMTTHGRTGWTRWRLGSVADDVIRNGDIPVLLVTARVAAQAVPTLHVADVMIQDPGYLSTADTAAAALRKMIRRNAGAAPVVDDEGNLVGMLSQHELAKSADRGGSGSVPAAFSDWAQGTTVGAILQQETVTIDEDTTLAAAMKALVQAHVDAIPVVRGRRLVGIVTLPDVLSALAEDRSGAGKVTETAAPA